jgi:hypothetical protein
MIARRRWVAGTGFWFRALERLFSSHCLVKQNNHIRVRKLGLRASAVILPQKRVALLAAERHFGICFAGKTVYAVLFTGWMIQIYLSKHPKKTGKNLFFI